MKQQNILFGAITFVLLSMTMLSAFYPGGTVILNNTLNAEEINWLIINNESELTVLPEVSYNLENITIYFPMDMPPNNFDMVFIKNQTNIIEVPGETIYYNSGGGGSSGTRIVYKDRDVIEYKIVEGEDIVTTETITTPGETIIETKIPKWILVIVGVLFLIVVVGIVIYFKEDGDPGLP